MWNVNVLEKATQIIEHFVNGTDCPIEPEPLATGLGYIGGINPNSSNFCETCQRVFIGDHQFNAHMQSKRHKKQLGRAKKNACKDPNLGGKFLQDSNPDGNEKPITKDGESSSF